MLPQHLLSAILTLLPTAACRNVAQTLQVVLQEYGVRGLWRGTGPTVVRLSFGAGINFVALEKLKHFMLDVLPHASGQLGYLQAAAVGGKTGVLVLPTCILLVDVDTI
jgi:hypothetical protein